MGMTLRQFQKLLHKSKRGSRVESSVELGRFAELLCNQPGEWGSAAVQNGCLRGTCTCRTCMEKGHQTNDVTSLVDSLCHRYGPDIDALQALKKWLRCEKQKQPQPQPGSGDGQGESQPQEQEQSSSDSSEGEGQGQGEGQPQPQPQPLSAADEAAIKEWQEQQAAAAREAAAEAAERQASEQRWETRRQLLRREVLDAAKAAKAARKAAKQQKNRQAAKAAQAALAAARRQLARQPTGNLPLPCGPSRNAMRQIAGATARLQRVSPKLRQKMAELINRLVATSGTAGEELAPTPRIDSRKLVKRMLVRRPLGNALKEDVQRGRPVTLFLPDISPSCAAQAQDACDLANAAGYAGVAGSDVLVMPHSNGCVECGDAYTPWFNGKPAPMAKDQFAALLNRVVAGTSQYRIRVVVAIGDHDAEEMYEEILRVRQITKLVWLHNDTRESKSMAALASARDRPIWASDRLHLVYGCHDQKEMLRGLDLALKKTC